MRYATDFLLRAVVLSAVLSGVPIASCAVARAASLTLHVAANGNNGWSGRLAEPKDGDGPFLTLQRARDEIRKLKAEGGLPSGGVEVEIGGGAYALTAPLALTAGDSGTVDAPVVYRAKPGDEVRIVGGVEVTKFQPVTDPATLRRLDEAARGKVLQADLNAAGVKDLGQVVGSNRLEVFFQDKPMTLARWPNDGFVRIVDVVGGEPHKIHGIPGDKIGRFTYEGDRPERWVGEKDVWLHGYWFWDWSDQRQQIESIDTAKHVVSLVPPYHGYGYRKGQWYYAFNLLPELDAPGEWYLDHATGILYFWPPAPFDQGKVIVSAIPSVITLDSVSHVTMRGLTLEGCRGTAIQGGSVDDVHIVGCTMRNTGGWAVSLSGKDSGVEGCDIYATADGGIQLTGGDRKTLTPARLVADNNHIHHYGRWNRMYQAGIVLQDVGNCAVHNLIDNAPHNAICFGGNDQRIELNEIHSVCHESNDAGAIYSGRDWTMRGTVIRHNYLHDITGFEGKGCIGVYLDDQFSGTKIVGNLFHKVTSAAFIGGGRDCTIANNVFVDCNPSVHVDSRGLGWAGAITDHVETMRNGLGVVPYQDSLWAARYPELVHILDEEPMAPRNNLIARNICAGGRWDDFDNKARPLVKQEANLVDNDPGFVDREHLNFQLKDDSPAFKLGFERIPIEKMGLYASPNRASWPVQHTVRPVGRHAP